GPVQVACQSGVAASLAAGGATDGMGPAPQPTTYVIQQVGVPATWAAGTPALLAALPVDLSATADVCSVGPAAGGAVATGYFNPEVEATLERLAADSAPVTSAAPDTEAQTTLSTAYSRIQAITGRKRFLHARRLV